MNLPDHTADAKLSMWQAQHILASQGLTRERVLALTKDIPRARPMVITDRSIAAVRERIPPPPPPDCDAPPANAEERHAAAHKAVSLARAGVGLCAALQRVGLAGSYSTALRQCMIGSGPLIDAAKAREPATGYGRNQVPFCRWFLDINGINGVGDPDNAALRDALKRSSQSPKEIAFGAGLTPQVITDFVRGKTLRMKAETRARVWASLNS